MTKSIVLYVDILGFSEMVQQADKEAILNNIKEGLRNSIRFFDAFQETLQALETKVSVNKVNYKLFSDNLYLSIKLEEQEKDFDKSVLLAIIFARSYQESMLHHKYLVRGAISYGEDYNDETIIFSPALIKAYNLESKTANYPRIIIDHSIIDRMLQNFSLHPKMLTLFNNSIMYDWAFTYFVNPIGLICDYNKEGEDFQQRKIIDTELRMQMLEHFNLKRRELLMADKMREHEKVLWLVELFAWLNALEFTPDKVVNKLGLSFMMFQ